jgi:phosphosulfolactate synthase
VSFLDIPQRTVKPRECGLTHVLDRGLSLAEVDSLMETAGASVDIVKLGWGTALVSANLRPKLARYAEHGIPVVLGGTLTELAIKQGRVEGLAAWLGELGLRHVEMSRAT